jgi:hypothetical protein
MQRSGSARWVRDRWAPSEASAYCRVRDGRAPELGRSAMTSARWRVAWYWICDIECAIACGDGRDGICYVECMMASRRWAKRVRDRRNAQINKNEDCFNLWRRIDTPVCLKFTVNGAFSASYNNGDTLPHSFRSCLVSSRRKILLVAHSSCLVESAV